MRTQLINQFYHLIQNAAWIPVSEYVLPLYDVSLILRGKSHNQTVYIPVEYCYSILDFNSLSEFASYLNLDVDAVIEY